MNRNIQIYSFSVAGLFFLTGISKVWSAFGGATALKNLDPIFGLQFRQLILIAGVLELAIAAFCLFANNAKLSMALVSWLATIILVYRLILEWIGWHLPCGCMGHFTDALHISPHTADTAMKIILAYLLLGSYATLFWLWRQHRKAEGRMQNNEIKPAGNSEMGIGG